MFSCVYLSFIEILSHRDFLTTNINFIISIFERVLTLLIFKRYLTKLQTKRTCFVLKMIEPHKKLMNGHQYVKSAYKMNVSLQGTRASYCVLSWKRPPPGISICNYDCSYRQEEETSKAAWIVRDDAGF